MPVDPRPRAGHGASVLIPASVLPLGAGSLLGTVLLFGGTAAAQDWPHWRGPNYNGSTTATGLPVKFSQKENVAWAAELPGPGACTPIVIGERIFLSSVDSARNRLVAMCLGRKDGKVLWKHDAGTGYGATDDRGRVAGARTTYASPSATTDGKDVVVFFYGNGDLAGFDYAGKKLWARNIQADYGNFAFQWTFSASPTVWEDKVFLPVLQRNVPARRRGGDAGDSRQGIESFILAIDPKTGKTIYKHVRPSDAQMESLESYGTTIPHVDASGRKELLLAGGDVLTGHDPATGKELWRWGTWNQHHNEKWWRLVPSVVVGDGIALVCAPKRAPVYAIKLGGKGEIEMDAGMAWRSDGRPNPVSSDVPTPAFHDGHFYVLSDVRSSISKVQAKDGKVLWTTPLSRDFLWRSSPTVADGKIYCMNHNGEVVVIDSDTGKALHHAFMGTNTDDQIRSSVVVAHNTLFIRTNTHLYAVKL